MTADELLEAIKGLCEAHARAGVARVATERAASEADLAHLVARAEYWESAVQAQYAAVVHAVRNALPQTAVVETFRPVRALDNGHIELYARDQGGWPIAVRLDGAQAIAIGTHLTVHAAIALDRTGAKVHAMLPAVSAAPLAVIGPPPASVPASGRAAVAAPPTP